MRGLSENIQCKKPLVWPTYLTCLHYQQTWLTNLTFLRPTWLTYLLTYLPVVLIWPTYFSFLPDLPTRPSYLASLTDLPTWPISYLPDWPTYLTCLPDLPAWPIYLTCLPDPPTWPTYLKYLPNLTSCFSSLTYLTTTKLICSMQVSFAAALNILIWEDAERKSFQRTKSKEQGLNIQSFVL